VRAVSLTTAGEAKAEWLKKKLLSTHADRQGVDISVTVCFSVCVSMVTDFSTEGKASSVKFCTAVHRRPFCELCSSRSPKLDESARAWFTPTHM